MIKPIARVPCEIWRIPFTSDGMREGTRAIPEEAAIALTFNTATYAVMMATPQDLEDFAIGFAMTEGIVASPDAIDAVDIVEEDAGIELRIWLSAKDAAEFLGRRRKMAGPTGCGLCGIESLIEAMRPPPHVAAGDGAKPAEPYTPDNIMTAVSSLASHQDLNRETHAIHATGFWDRAQGLVAVREDVGRHNALDKLAGALARQNHPAMSGIVVLTSRVSIEMVQKSAQIGAPVIAAVSAPTALAVRMAEACGITLVGIARNDGFEVFTHPGRILGASKSDVA